MSINKGLINVLLLSENLWVAIPGKALNVSYSESGLA